MNGWVREKGVERVMNLSRNQVNQFLLGMCLVRNNDVLTTECILRLWKPMRMDFKRSM